MLEQLSGVPFTILSFIVALSVVVFVHEFGHFIVARRNGVRCESFSIGLGPELFGRTDRHGTRWKVSLLPLGGYVKMFGESETMQAIEGGVDDADKGEAKTERVRRELTPEERAVSFKYKTVGQRAAIVFAGPAVNFIFAIAVYWVMFMMVGWAVTEPVIGKVMEGSAAAEAGIQADDRIVSIDGTAIERFEDIQKIVGISNGTPMSIGLRRDGQDMSVTLTPRMVEDKDPFGNVQKHYLIGIGPSGDRHMIPLNPLEAFSASVGHTYEIVKTNIVAMGQMVAGTRGTEDLGGPIRIAKYSGQAAKSGLGGFVEFMAILSLSLGFINLFPVPLLDGGHLLFYAIEAARGRPLSEQIQEWGLRVGLALVVALMVFATWNDFSHL